MVVFDMDIKSKVIEYSVTRHSLLLDGKCVGYRYYIDICNKSHIIKDVGRKLGSVLHNGLTSLNLKVEDEYAIKCKVENGVIDSVKPWSHDVEELETRLDILKFVSDVQRLICQYTDMYYDFNQYTSILDQELRNCELTIRDYGYQTGRINTDKFYYGLQCIGGEIAWDDDGSIEFDSVKEDISKAVKNTMEKLNVNITWIEDNFWVYFFFDFNKNGWW